MEPPPPPVQTPQTPSPMDPPAAPAPATPPAAAPAKTKPPLASDDPFMTRVMADMGFTVKEGKLEKAPEPEPKPSQSSGQDFTTLGEAARFKAERDAKPPEPKPPETPAAPAATTPPASTPPPPAAPAKPKVEVEKGKPIEEIVEGVMNRLQKKQEEPKPEAAPPAPAPKTEDPDASYIESLDENQREEIELARYAAKANPEKYGKLADKWLSYFKKVDELIAEKQKEDPEWDPSSDDSFKSFTEENRPSYQPGDRRKLERSMIAAEVRVDLEKEIKPQLEKSERAARIQEIKPELEKAVPSFREQVAQTMAADEKSPLKAVMSKAVEKGLSEEGWNEAKAIDPLAATIAKSFTEDAVTYGKLYLEMATGVRDQVQYRPDLSPNHKHNQEALLQAKLWEFIDTQESIFNQHGGNLRVIDGRTFLPRREFSSLPKAEQAKHWTIGHKDVLNLISDNASIGAKEALEIELKRRETEGYTRNGAKQTPKPETPPAARTLPAPESPKTTLTPSPGAGNATPQPPSPALMPKEQLDKMLMPGVRQWA